VIVGRPHDLVPQLAGARLRVHPKAVFSLVDEGGALFSTLSASRDRIRVRPCLVHQLDLGVVLDRPHEGIGDADRDVEVGEVPPVLGVDEFLDVGMVAAQHAHLRAAARPGRFHRLAGAVEHAHVGHRAARARARALHLRALGADGGEVVADSTPAAHGFGGFLQGGVDAGLAVHDLRDRIAHRLHEAVDERGLHRDAGGGIDAAGGDEAGFHRLVEALLPVGALVLAFGRGEGARHASPHVRYGLLLVLGVFLEQSLAADRLLGNGLGDRGKGFDHDACHSIWG